jgi:26S proteasome regulatory subunit N5
MAETDAGDLVRMEKDYSSLVDKQLPLAIAAADKGDMDTAMEILGGLERKTRNAADTHSLTRVLVTAVDILFKAKAWDLLDENLQALAKRRGQIKQSIARMVQACCAQLELLKDDDPVTARLIETLRQVTTGKIYVEVERARLSHRLSLIKEAQGDTAEAAKIMLDLQIETFGAMDKEEKVRLLLEQMRLSLLRRDFVRAQIVAKKINPSVFADTTLAKLKAKYYKYMVEIDSNDQNYLAVSRHHKALGEIGEVGQLADKGKDVEKVNKDKQKKLHHLRSAVLYLLLAPHSVEQNDQMERMAAEADIDQIPTYQSLIKLFKNPEIIRWRRLKETYETELRLGTTNSPPTELFPKTDTGEKRWETLARRVVEHNIRVISKYYTRITLKRMSQLLEQSTTKTEQALTELVSSGEVDARINRLDGTVSFSRTKDIEEKLDDWCDTVDELMRNIQKTTHLINTEYMVHQHLLAKH